MIQKAAALGNWWLAASSWQCACLCITSRAQVFGKTSNHSGDSASLQPRFDTLWLLAFPKLKSPLKGKRFQTVGEIQENTMGQLMAFGRTVWGPKVPVLKGTEASLSYVQCFLYLMSSSVNVSIFSYYIAVCLLDRPHLSTCSLVNCQGRYHFCSLQKPQPLKQYLALNEYMIRLE